ncbi:unnamed protein product, partial [Musa banksii]
LFSSTEEEPLRVSFLLPQDADLRENPHWQDHHPRGGILGHHRQCQGQDPRQGGDPPRPAEAHLRW